MIDPRTPVPQTHKHLKRGQIAQSSTPGAGAGTGREFIFKDASGFGGRAFGPKLQSFSFGAAFDSGGEVAASALPAQILGAMVPGGWCCGWPLLVLFSGMLLEPC